MIIPDTYEEFEAMIQRGIRDSWKRAHQVIELETSVGVHARLDPFNLPSRYSAPLYEEAVRSYIMGLDLATIMLSSTASESWLRELMDKWDEISPTLGPLINEAESGGLIKKEMVQRLDRLRDTIRNVVVHGHRQLSVHTVGMKRTGTYHWTAREGEVGLSFQEGALYAMETYLHLIKETQSSPSIEKEAKERYSQAKGKPRGVKKASTAVNFPQEKGKSRDKAAKLLKRD